MAASRNLAQINYLHSNKINFFKNLESFKIGDKLQYQKQIEDTISKLKDYKTIAEKKEKDFYEDFSYGEKIKTPQEWSQRYLRIGVHSENGNKNKIAVLTNIFHSVELYKILSEYTINDKKFVDILQKTLKSSKDLSAKQKKQILSVIEKNSTISFGEVFNRLGYFGKGKKIAQQNFFAEFKKVIDGSIEEGLKNLIETSIDDIKGTLSKQSSDKLKKIQKLITRERANPELKLEKSSAFIKNKMIVSKAFTEQEIEKVLEMWEILFYKDLSGTDKRLTSDSIAQVEGKVQELERRITLSEVFIKFDVEDPFENLKENIKDEYKIGNYKTLVQSTGDVLKKRFRKENGEYDMSESKTDSIFIGKSGKTYKIQEKNSINEMYEQFDSSGDPEKLLGKYGQIKLQSKVKFSTLQQYFIEGKLFTDEELKYLIYLLINFNALNIWSSGGQLWKADGFSKTKTDKEGNKKQTAVKAAFAVDLVDRVMTKGIMAYVSDLIIPDKVNNLIHLDFDNWNFIIFRGQMLIPISYILDQLIIFMEDAKKTLFSLRTYSGLENISDSYLKTIYERKQIEKNKETGEDIEYDYHLQNLVDIGIEAGKEARENLIIKGIYLKFNKNTVKNLITPVITPTT